MKLKGLFIFLLGLAGYSCTAQLDEGSDLERSNVYLPPPIQIEVKLSFNSRSLRNDPRAFSVVPDREGIDMMAIYRDRNELEQKEYVPNAAVYYERQRQAQQQQSTLSRPVSLSAGNPYYSNSNFAWQQMRRQSYFNQLYLPIYRY